MDFVVTLLVISACYGVLSGDTPSRTVLNIGRPEFFCTTQHRCSFGKLDYMLSGPFDFHSLPLLVQCLFKKEDDSFLAQTAWWFSPLRKHLTHFDSISSKYIEGRQVGGYADVNSLAKLPLYWPAALHIFGGPPNCNFLSALCACHTICSN